MTGVDYIVYTQQNQEAFIQKMKDTLPFWDSPHYVIDNEDATTDIFVTKSEAMFQQMEEKGFYTVPGSGEGPFLVMFNSHYSPEHNRITVVLPKAVQHSEFAQKVLTWIQSIL
ncbi:hypothetical protein [Chitinophaga qingshengii]|uniref:Uncharacterized protein n=1 Tax=Chitinophaga qingshengii TaxID=1569794 RepID=A0ABR7TS81_9BACT|nr:hypothetical protein [Chitinophaga qingshengii]MBC9932500.1 hypothetical protein [Chitinophaga qingshengii]